MKSKLPIHLFVTILLTVSLAGCGKQETPAPAVVEQPAIPPVPSRPAPVVPDEPEPQPLAPSAEALAKNEREQAIALIEQLGGKYKDDPNIFGRPLIRLNLAGTKVNGVGMRQLQSLTSLQSLDLAGTPVGDDGLAAIREMRELKSLHLWSCPGLTDKGLEHLQNCTKMEWMGIGNSGNGITGSGLVHLKGMTNLKFLAIDILRKLEDRHLEHLSPLTNLEELRLTYDEQITDAGLKHIQGLSNLKRLGLAETAITDAGLEHLKGMQKLVHLNIQKTKVTDAGVEDLKKALPNLKEIIR